MYCIWKSEKNGLYNCFSYNTIIVWKNCISAKILIKIVHFAHFQAYFLVFQTIFRTATMTLHFFSKKSQNSPKTFFWEPYDPMFFKKLYEKMNFNNTIAKKWTIITYNSIVFTTCINWISAIVQRLYTTIVHLYCILIL